MAQDFAVQTLAAAGSTGNVTSPATKVDPDAETINCLFVVEAVGATPTVTFKYQISEDAVNWFDMPYIDDTADTMSQAAKTVTAVGATELWFHPGPSRARDPRYVRLVVSANTNVTFRSELRQGDSD